MPKKQPLFTKDVYLKYRHPLFGDKNPTLMNNPVWQWIRAEKQLPFWVEEAFSEEHAGKPNWCYYRMGQSETLLDDGTKILIAGEHEDSYDPDFHIYNDVTVIHPDGAVDIYGYPKDVFPPTDFHSATLVENHIYIIGSLGYMGERQVGKTQVCRLDINTFEIEEITTSGDNPGWISDHSAILSGNHITISMGMRYVENNGYHENFHDWTLCLDTFTWKKSLHRPWSFFIAKRKDGKMNQLWEIGQLDYDFKHNKDKFEAKKRAIEEQLGSELDYVYQLKDELYKPSITFEETDIEAKYNERIIKVDDVVVCYKESWNEVKIIIKGELPTAIVDILCADLKQKLSKLESTPYIIEQIAV